MMVSTDGQASDGPLADEDRSSTRCVRLLRVKLWGRRVSRVLLVGTSDLQVLKRTSHSCPAMFPEVFMAQFAGGRS